MSEPQQGAPGAPGGTPGAAGPTTGDPQSAGTPAAPTGRGPAAPSAPGGWGGLPPAGPPGYGAAPGSAAPQYGTPQYGTPQYGTPQYGTPQYGTPQYGAPQYGQPEYGAPQYGQPQYGAPQYGTPQYGQAQYGGPAGYGAAVVQRGVIPLRPLGLGEIFDGAFRSVRANPRVMFGFSALLVAVASLAGIVVQMLVMPLIAGSMSSVSSTFDPEGAAGLDASLSAGIGTLAFLPWYALAQVVLTGVLTASVSRSVIGQTVSLGELWSRHWKHVLLLAGLGILYSVGFVLLLGLLATPAVLFGVAGNEPMTVVSVLLALLLAVVLGTWLTIRTLLVPPTLVLEEQRAWPSVVRGWRLSRGSFWRLLGIYLLTNLVVWLVGQVVGVPFGLIALLVFNEPTSFGAVVVSAIGNGLVFTVTTVFTSAVVALLYIDVRMRREGLDVELGRAAERAAAEAENTI